MSFRDSLARIYNGAVNKVVTHEPLTLKEKAVYRGRNAAETATGLGYAVCFLAALPFQTVGDSIRAAFNRAYKNHASLESFDHPPFDDVPLTVEDNIGAHLEEKTAAAPYWQDIVFGEGRAEKLLKRLEGMPQAESLLQKYLLSTSYGGLQVPSSQIDLLKYGLNDSIVATAAHNLAQAIRYHLRKDGTDITQTRLTREGLATAGGKLVIGKEDKFIPCISSGIKNQALKNTDEARQQAFERVLKISGVVYDWLVEDVAPAVPSIIPGFTVRPDTVGGLTIATKQESALERFHSSPSLFEIFSDGYKGTLPDYRSGKPCVPQPGQPK